MAAAGKYLKASDCISRLNPTTFLAIYDDNDTNSLDAASENKALQDDIDDAEGEVDSWLITENALPLPAITSPTVDRLVRVAVKDFFTVYAWRRHPEYVRTFGESGRADALYKVAVDRMKRIQEASQQMPDIVQQSGTKPKNVGGIVYDSGPRAIIDSSSGDSNSGDF